MQRKLSHYLKGSVATVLAASTGLAVGFQVETTHAVTGSNAGAYVVMQAPANDAFVQLAMRSPHVHRTVDCVDSDRACGARVETERVRL